jgi:hypothetical protein
MIADRNASGPGLRMPCPPKLPRRPLAIARRGAVPLTPSVDAP